MLSLADKLDMLILLAVIYIAFWTGTYWGRKVERGENE